MKTPLEILFSHPLINGTKFWALGFVKLRSRPKYVKGREPLPHSKVLNKTSSLSLDILIGTIIVFWKFTLRPVDMEKVFSRGLRKNNCLVSPLAMIKVLSAYCITWKSWVCSNGICRLSILKSWLCSNRIGMWIVLLQLLVEERNRKKQC